MSLEHAGEMGLVAEAKIGRDTAQRAVGEQEFLGAAHPQRGGVAVRCQPRPLPKDADEVSRVESGQLGEIARRVVKSR